MSNRTADALERRIRRESSVRGMLLGLALGDAHARGTQTLPIGWRGSATTQLMCFVADGLIRAQVRGIARGICHPPTVMWHALGRWSEQQGLNIPGVRKRWEGGNSYWPDGWLAEVPVLQEGRGAAPATVTALQRHHGRVPNDEKGTPPRSIGHHALTRAVPLAAIESVEDETWTTWERELAAYSHDPAVVPDVVEVGLLILRCAAVTSSVEQWERKLASLPDRRQALAMVDSGRKAPEGSVHGVLSRAVDAVRQTINAEHSQWAVLLDSLAAEPGACAFAGAIYGAICGAERLPTTVWNLELGWVVDTLARDLVVQLDEPRSPESGTVEDPRWSERYPGW